jgi:hypothetical protein
MQTQGLAWDVEEDSEGRSEYSDLEGAIVFLPAEQAA